MHAKPDLRVVLKWMITRSGSRCCAHLFGLLSTRENTQQIIG